MKFLSEPKTTSVYYKDLEPEDTPWITICPNPGVNFSKLESLLPPNSTISADGINSIDIEEWSQNSNLSIAKILSESMIWNWALQLNGERKSKCDINQLDYTNCSIYQQGHILRIQ
jgi:hypothetical protein